MAHELDRDELAAQLRIERIKAQSACREVEKIRKQAAIDRQSIEQVLNDLFLEYTVLRKSTDREASEAAEAIRQRDHTIADYEIRLRDVTATLDDLRASISFRALVAAGRPIVAASRVVRSVLSRGGKR